MLKLPPDARIFTAVAPVDMRCSFSGLCAIITETLGANPVGGDLWPGQRKRPRVWARTPIEHRVALAVIVKRRLDQRCDPPRYPGAV